MSKGRAKTAAQALNRLAKWRTIFTGWQLGTRSKFDPEAAAVRDAAESRLILRAEVSALVALLVQKEVITKEEWEAQLIFEADNLEGELERLFPGASASDEGMVLDPVVFAQTAKGWRP